MKRIFRARDYEPDADRDLSDELEAHLELLVEDLMAEGVAEEEARARAHRTLNRGKGAHATAAPQARRNQRRRSFRNWVDALARDLRYAFRRMAQSPGFTAIALLSMALGIGANTAIFSLANALLIRDLPFRNAEELVDLYTSNPGFSNGPFSYPDYLDVKEGTGSLFSEIGGATVTFGQTEQDGRVVSLMGEVVTGSYFPLLGLEPALGRAILPEDDVAPGSHFVVMLCYEFWQSAYDGDPGVLGRTIRISGDAYEIIGVAPRDYQGFLRGLRPDFLISVQMMGTLQGSTGDPLAGRESYGFFPKARLKPGVSLEQVTVTLDRIAEELRRDYPEAWDEESMGFKATSSSKVVVNPSIDRIIVPAVFMAVAVVGLVLLIACANLASFLLARATNRRKEIALRLALGAGRGSLIRQLLTETLVLALLGGALGLGLGVWILRLLPRLDIPLPIRFGLNLGLDGTVLGLTAGATLVAGLFFGLAPALQATNPDVAGTLKDEGTGGGRPRRITLRKLLVAGQMTASLVLLVAAGLFLRSLQARRGSDPGFGRDPAAIVTFNPRDPSTPDEGRILLRQILEEVSALPGVQAAGLTDNLPLNLMRTSTLDVTVDGMAQPEGQAALEIDQCIVGPGFFDAVGIPLVRGRNFDSSDRPGEGGAIIINQVMADRFWPGEDPLGRTIYQEDGEELVVVGVARSATVRSLGESPRPFIYRSFSQYYSTLPSVVVRTRSPDGARSLLPQVMETIRGVDPGAVFVDTKTMEEHLAVTLLPARLGALFSAVFAAVALVLASIGLYGVVSYAVASRSREMGIRMSLGADARGVVIMMVRGGMRLVLIGGAIGMVLAIGASTVLQSLLYGVKVLDPVTFMGVPAVLLGVALLAAWIPARRASRVDPARTLRTE